MVVAVEYRMGRRVFSPTHPHPQREKKPPIRRIPKRTQERGRNITREVVGLPTKKRKAKERRKDSINHKTQQRSPFLSLYLALSLDTSSVRKRRH